MRMIVTVLLSLSLQSPTTPTLPPAYPRPGATKILDNPDVQVWNIAWLKGQPSPLHKHIYDLTGVYYEPGDRMIISPEGAKRPVSTKAWSQTLQCLPIFAPFMTCANAQIRVPSPTSSLSQSPRSCTKKSFNLLLASE